MRVKDYGVAMSKRTGAIILMAVSTVLWLAVFAVPWFDGDVASKAVTAGALYAASYVFFFAAIALVGREGYALLKEQLAARLRRGEPGPAPAIRSAPLDSSSGPGTST